MGWTAKPQIELSSGDRNWDYISYGGVIVRSEVQGLRRVFVDQLGNPLGLGNRNPNTLVYEKDEIWSATEIRMDSPLLAHELAHVAQQRSHGVEEYRKTYIKDALGSGFNHDSNPMEVDANRRAHLPDNWNGQTPDGWTFEVPVGILPPRAPDRQ
jgi:hypothetical protein